ncbi:MAG: DUF362 domain-containing protein [Bryobacteraceae bacterium]|nr:DUF362 domain-containing protein [Bryobacteraceae bacterium]
MHPAIKHPIGRRQWLASAAGLGLSGRAWSNPAAPASRVSIARCEDYGPAIYPTLKTMFDQLGGIAGLVKGKTVGIKVNLTGGPRNRIGNIPIERSAYTHPDVVGAAVRLISEAGATCVRILEGCYSCGDPLGEFMYDAGWDPMALVNAGRRVELENTNVLGSGKRYHRRMTPGGGLIFPGFDLNHAYDESDVIVSIAKMKEHATCGITLAMKNMFGITPVTIYGDQAGKDEPSPDATGGRGVVMHQGRRGPSLSAPQEIDPSSSRDDKWRVPRIVVDLCAAVPIHLSIIDGIDGLAGGEGSWVSVSKHVRPRLLVAGLNPVSTDAVSAALMGFDPMAGHRQIPFEQCDSTLLLAEQRGLGTRDLRRIEVAGAAIEQAKFDFRSASPGPWRRVRGQAANP